MVQSFESTLNHVTWHIGIDLTRQLNKSGRLLHFTCFPGEIKRIDWDAVPTESRSGSKFHKSEWFGACRIQYLVDIDSHGGINNFKLINHSNIHRAKNVFRKLYCFSRFGVTNRYSLNDSRIIHRTGKHERFVTVSADHFWNLGCVEVRV